jgi:branched-chain amino acid transport system permease protein
MKRWLKWALPVIAFAVVGLFVVWLRRGRFGRRLLALRDSPAASATVGVDLVWTKLLVFALAAAMAGFAGGLLGTFRGTVGSTDFAMLLGIPFLLLLVVQDEVSFVVFGVSVLVALTRIGPGLAALGVARNPEGMVTQFGRGTPRPGRASSSRGG